MFIATPVLLTGIVMNYEQLTISDIKISFFEKNISMKCDRFISMAHRKLDTYQAN